MAVTKYVWLGDNILYETDGNDVVTVEYTYSPEPFGELISEYRNGTTYTHHYDAQGSTVALTNDAGTVRTMSWRWRRRSSAPAAIV